MMQKSPAADSDTVTEQWFSVGMDQNGNIQFEHNDTVVIESDTIIHLGDMA